VNFIFFKRKKMLKPWQTPLNKAPSQGGKERAKMEGPEYEPKEQTPK